MKSRQQRRDEGEERNQEWRSLSKEQQIASLDRRLGKGIGATRQRKKLQ